MRPILLFLFVLLAAQFGHAQKHIQLDVNVILSNNGADTLDWNGNTFIVVYRCEMTSDTAAPFNGTINIRRRNNHVDTSQRVAQVSLSNFLAGDTAIFDWYDTLFTVDGVEYQFGDNVSQLWIIPDSGAAYVPDTVTYFFYLNNLLGAQAPTSLQRRLVVYPNPVGQQLHLDFREDAHKLQAIRVVSLQGQVLQTETAPVKSIDFSGLPAGCYLLELQYADGVRGSYRVMHE